MKINNEECERVETFESLRAGDIVWILPCGWCGGRHRRILLRFDPCARTVGTNGLVTEGPVWRGEPQPRCARGPRRRALAAETVAEGVVYRVVDPDLEAPAESTHEKRPEVVR